jgi:hypothetical protein
MIEATLAYRILTARDTLAGTDGLNAINTFPLNQGALVLAAGDLYRLDRQSVTPADGLLVVAPIAGPGRWLRIASANNAIATVATIAAMAALAVPAPDLVWVESLACFWHFNPNSVLAADGITVVAALGGGRWERMVPTTAPDWLGQVAWYIDPLLGNDENIGALATPLRTFAELDRRLSVGPLRVNITVTVAAGAVVPTAELSVELAGHTCTIQGTATTVATGTVDAYTDRVHNVFPVAPAPPILTDAGIIDFTPYEGMRLRITDGLSVGAVTWLDLANPGGGGVTTCRCTRFGSAPAAGNSLPNAVAPAATSAYVIEELPVIAGLSLTARTSPGMMSIFQPVTFVVRNLYIGNDVLTGSQLTVKVPAPWFFEVDGCRIDANVHTTLDNTYRQKYFTRCKFGGPSGASQSVFYGGVTLSFCLFKERQGVLVTADTMFAQSSLWSAGASGTGILLSSTDNLALLWILDDVQIWDTTVQAIQFSSAGQIRTENGLSGTNGGRGLVMVATTGGQSFYWQVAGDLPNLSGMAGVIRVAGLTNIDLTWTAVATVGFRSDAQRGVGTLALGTATIAARNSDVRPPSLTKDTPAGAPQGVLSCPAATRTAAQFVVNAADLATGALVNSDTSTFIWEIPPFERDVTIAQANQVT